VLCLPLLKWQAVLAALEVESTRGTTWAVLEICTSLLEISSDTGPQAWSKGFRPKRMALQEFAALSLFPPCLVMESRADRAGLSGLAQRASEETIS